MNNHPAKGGSYIRATPDSEAVLVEGTDQVVDPAPVAATDNGNSVNPANDTTSGGKR